METQTHLHFTISPFYFQELLELRIEKRMNAHTKLRARGIVSEAEMDRIAEMARINQTIAFSITDGGKTQTLFSGILGNVELFVNMNVREAVIDALGFTALMDVKKLSRSFQNQQMPYEALFEHVTQPYGGGVIDQATNGASIGTQSTQNQGIASKEASKSVGGSVAKCVTENASIKSAFLQKQETVFNESSKILGNREAGQIASVELPRTPNDTSKLLISREISGVMNGASVMQHAPIQSLERVEIKRIAGLSNDGVMDMASNGAPIGDVIIQYEETDWQFMKRLASHFNTQLIPADGFGKLKYYVGKPGLKAPAPLASHKYQIYKDLTDAAWKANNGLEAYGEQDAIVYEVKSDIALELGMAVQFAGHTLYVEAIDTRLEESLLLHTYRLRSDVGTQVRKAYNERIRGLSLFGNVTDIQKDQIQMLLDIDEDNPVVGNKWFSYSTVYSSPDGSGWYAMPEKGDRIRLACPDWDESNSFSASAVDLEASNPDFRAVPDHKIMHTVHGKYLEFRPGQVEMLANSGTAITMKDEGGVYIRSRSDVTINAQKDINISSADGNISIEGNEVYLISMQGGIVKLTENVVVTGQEVKVQ